MKIVAIRVGICPVCSRPVLDTQRHVVEWEDKEAFFYHEACLERARVEGEKGLSEALQGARQKAGF